MVKEAETAESTALSRLPTLNSHGSHSQQLLHRTPNGLSQDSLQQQLSSTSMESFGVEHSTSGDSYGPPITSDIHQQQQQQQHQQHQQHQQQDNANDVAREYSHNKAGSSPLSTISSSTNPAYAHGSSYSSLEPIPITQAKDVYEDPRTHIAESVATGPPVQSNLPTQVSSLADVYHGYGALEQPPAGTPSSKRNSFLGMFSVRGKKGGQDADLHHHQESQSSSSYGSPSLTATAPIYERQSFDSQHSPFLQPALPPPQGQRYPPTVEVIPPSLMNSPSGNLGQAQTDSRQRPSLDQSMTRVVDPNEPNLMLTDDDIGGHWAPPIQWAEGERLEDSQDESDNVANPATKV
jgi:hypothetical protein